MRRVVARAIVAACCVSLVACTTVQSVKLPNGSAPPPATTPGTQADKESESAPLVVGHLVKVTLKSGSTQNLVVTSIGTDSFESHVEDSVAKVHVDFKDVAHIEQTRGDTAKTLGLAVVIIGISVILGYALGHALAHSAGAAN